MEYWWRFYDVLVEVRWVGFDECLNGSLVGPVGVLVGIIGTWVGLGGVCDLLKGV